MSKKQTGMSSYKAQGRKNHRYRVQINNRRYEKRFYGTKEEREEQVIAWKNKLIESQKKRNLDGSVTFDFFSAKFLHYLRTVKDKNTGRNLYRPRTIEEYSYALKRFKKLIKLNYMNDLTFENVAEFRRILREGAQANEEDNYGVNKDVGAVIRAFKWGMPESYVPVINFDVIEPLRVSKVVVTSFQPWQVELIIKYSNINMRIATKLGYYSGCRPEEVYNMLLKNIDFKNKIAWVEENAEDTAHNIKDRVPKANKERPVDLKDDLIADIKELNPKGPYLLVGKKNRPYTDKNFSNAFKHNLTHVNNMIKRHEPDTPAIEGTFKKLRKTNVTQAVVRGASKKDASMYAGHSTEKVTKEHYLDPEMIKEIDRKEKLKLLHKVKKFLPGPIKSIKKKAKK